MLFIIVLSSASFGLLVGVREMVIRDTDEGGIAFDQYMSGLRRYLKIRKYPKDLKERICTYYSLSKSGRNAFSETEVIADLPNSLKSEIAFYINHVILERVPLFAEFDLPLVKSLSSILFPEVFLRGDFVVKQGNIGEEMYFINTGVVEVFPDDGRFRVLKSVGDFFGEISLLQKTPRNANVRAITKCNIYVMKRKDYEEVMQYYPDERHSLERKLMPIFERAKRLSLALTDLEIDRQLQSVVEAEIENSGRENQKKPQNRRQSVIIESNGRRKTVRLERAMTLVLEVPEVDQDTEQTPETNSRTALNVLMEEEGEVGLEGPEDSIDNGEVKKSSESGVDMSVEKEAEGKKYETEREGAGDYRHIENEDGKGAQSGSTASGETEREEGVTEDLETGERKR